MNLYWTSLLPIDGLRHFVLVNKIKDKGHWYVLLVSVIDIEVNVKVSKNELENSGLWKIGWLELSKSESITLDYIYFKQRKNFSESCQILLKDSSPFYIP